MNILVTGKSGYVAKSIISRLQDKYNITAVGRDDFDLTNKQATSAWFKDKHFDVVIHTAAAGGSRLQQDDDTVLSANLNMFWNLVDNESCFGRFITFGSGAEIYDSTQPYGLSKRTIAEAMSHKEGYYNLRIYAVFDDCELRRRFIKANIMRYICREDMILHCDKFMDFFYMDDLVSLVDYYITASDPPPLIDCCYMEKIKLSDVASIINTQDNYRVGIEISTTQPAEEYTGNYIGMPIKLIGLQEGIKRTYRALKQLV